MVVRRELTSLGNVAMRSALTVAVAQPVCVPGDTAANARAHASAIRAAGAQLVVFPELSLTGYELDAEAVDPGDGCLSAIIAACAQTRATALAGAPIRSGDERYIATLVITGDGASVAYCKTFLGGDEPRVFAPGHGPAAIVAGGWRVGLGVCKDTRIPEHIDATLALGIDLYVAGLVHHPHELADQDARALRINKLGGVPVAFASAAGNAGGEFPRGAGHSCVWDRTGGIVARATAEAGQVAVATLAV